MRSSLEHLLLLGDRRHNGLQRRALVVGTEHAVLDGFDDPAYAGFNRPECFESVLIVNKPSVIDGFGVGFISENDRLKMSLHV
ncbi:hypothetical protein D3C73_1312760 [compost metagenome]